MSFLDSSRPRSVPWFFYSSAFLSAILFSAASYASVSYHRPLLVLALVTALAAAFFLVLFLRSRDEREVPINYRATFAFVGTLVFSLIVGMAQQLGLHSVSWLGLPAVMIVPWSFGLILHSWRDRWRLGCACFVPEKEGPQAELAANVGVARGTINAIETGKYDPSLLLAFKIARAFGKNVEEVFLYQENELPATTNPAVSLLSVAKIKHCSQYLWSFGL